VNYFKKIVKFLLYSSAIVPILIFIVTDGEFELSSYYIVYVLLFWIFILVRFIYKNDLKNEIINESFKNTVNNYHNTNYNYNNDLFISKETKQKKINGGLTDKELIKRKKEIRKKII
jgi:Ca2+/Na+ antiporter